MRKSTVLLSIIVMTSMVLTACGGGPTSTNVAPSQPPITAEVTETATEPPTEAPAATETPGVPVTGETNPARLSNQLDLNVWDEKGEQIGEVNDMVIDLDNSRISYVIVGVGGFLEIGEKDVLVPWNSLQLESGTGDQTGGEQNAFIYQGDQERINNAPDVDVNDIMSDRNTAAGDWDRDIRSYWESGVLPPTASPEATAAPEATATRSPEATADVSAVQVAELQGVILASDLLNSAITVSAQSESQELGAAEATATASTGQDNQVPADVNADIDDVIVDVATGEIRYIVLNASFEDGERWIPVPLSLLRWDANAESLVLNTDPGTLQNAPSFQDGQYPDMIADGWNSEFDTFWQNNPGTTR